MLSGGKRRKGRPKLKRKSRRPKRSFISLPRPIMCAASLLFCCLLPLSLSFSCSVCCVPGVCPLPLRSCYNVQVRGNPSCVCVSRQLIVVVSWRQTADVLA